MWKKKFPNFTFLWPLAADTLKVLYQEADIPILNTWFHHNSNNQIMHFFKRMTLSRSKLSPLIWPEKASYLFFVVDCIRSVGYSWRSMYNQREKYNQWGFRRHFYHVKTKFSTFFFSHLKLRILCYKKQEKKFEKILFLRWKIKFEKINFFFHCWFFTAIFFGGGQFSPNSKPYSNRSISTRYYSNFYWAFT